MGDFIGSTPFFLVMGALLVGLIVVFFVIRKKQQED